MLKRTIVATFTLAALAFGNQAMAATYVGVGVSVLDMKSSNSDTSTDFSAVDFRLGQEANRFISGEFRLGVGVDGGSYSDKSDGQKTTFLADGTNELTTKTESSNASLKLKYYTGVYLRGTLPVADVIFPYAIIGATHVKMDTDITNNSTLVSPTKNESKRDVTSLSGSGTGFSYGVGIDIPMAINFDLNLEYMSYYDKDEISLKGFSAGVTYRF